MEKYSEQAKLAAVQTYCTGELGWKAAAARHSVGVSSLRKWVAGYLANGVAGVVAKPRRWYSLEFKLEVLQRARDEGLSNRQAAALFDIRKFSIIAIWERAYEVDGMAGLDPRRSAGRTKSMKDAVPDPTLQRREDEACRREQLLEELNALRTENAYLKKVDALVRSQATSAQNKKRKS